MPKPVLSKRDFVRRYAQGEFGNASPTWDDPTSWLVDRAWKRYGYLYHIRNRVAGAQTWYNISAYSLASAWKEAIQTFNPSQLYISAMAPTEKTLFQGEVQRGFWGPDLYFTIVAKPMREALAMWSKNVNGIIATDLLQRFLCQRSYDWLLHLLEAYPDHVVEFSTYSVDWGTISGYNTVFWEVRNY